MKMVFDKFESVLELKRGRTSVLRLENAELFSRCVLSLAHLFEEGCPEPARLYEGEQALKQKDVILFVGDLLMFDLADKRFVTAAIKKISASIYEDSFLTRRLECLNAELAELLTNEFMQFSSDYILNCDWDNERYLKAFGFTIDSDSDIDLCSKAISLLKLAADLFPNKILAFVNLNTYLSSEQYDTFLSTAAAYELYVLSYERGKPRMFSNLENGICVNRDYLEI